MIEYNDAGNTVFYYARRLAQIRDTLQYLKKDDLSV